jgi:hypothetical protein
LQNPLDDAVFDPPLVVEVLPMTAGVLAVRAVSGGPFIPVTEFVLLLLLEPPQLAAASAATLTSRAACPRCIRARTH